MSAVTDLLVAPRPVFDVRSAPLTDEMSEAGLLHRGERAWRLRWYRVVHPAPGADLAALYALLADPAEEIVLSHADHVVPDAERASAALVTIAVAYHQSQFDQRAEAAEQALELLGYAGVHVRVADVTVVQLRPSADSEVIAERRRELVRFLVNPVDAEEVSLPAAHGERSAPERPGLPAANEVTAEAPAVLAMSEADRSLVVAHFNAEQRTPTVEEWTVLDTYWSDHCRHTTFRTEMREVAIASEPAREMWDWYQEQRNARGEGERPVTLMDLGTAMMRWRRMDGALPGVVFSAEVNACTVEVADVDMRWLVLFKNETHNHPTEIEPYGGAATCIGGAIRDPLSGRAYVYQAMRVSGCADPRTNDAPLPGKLSQRTITQGALTGYSSYGNQIGIATGLVEELYHPGFRAKRLEMGAVVGAVPAAHVRREEPAPGDVVLLIGGRTGRDGIGGATGSSVAHTRASIERAGAEVQKGNAPVERALQRLFRQDAFARLVKRSNDFGAGGIAVAVGEIASGVSIALDTVPLKYAGLAAREIAVSESQERMAVVVAPGDADQAIALAHTENLEATVIATVTAEPRMVMRWRGEVVADIDREFLDSAGALSSQTVTVERSPCGSGDPAAAYVADETTIMDELTGRLSDLRFASRLGLSQRFDSSIGGGTLLAAGAGRLQRSPVTAMAARLPHAMDPAHESTLATIMAYGGDPDALAADPFRGAYLAVLESVARVMAAGSSIEQIWLSLQEYFPRPGSDPARWGMPLAALLGALRAQRDLGVTAIGGKDSMSGTFESLDVPPTLISIALGIAPHTAVRSAHLTVPDRRVVLLATPPGSDGLPDAERFLHHARWLAQMAEAGAVGAVAPVRGAGWLPAVVQMCFGENLGFTVDQRVVTGTIPAVRLPFAPGYGSFLVEIATDDPLEEGSAYRVVLGETQPTGALRWGEATISMDDLFRAWSAPLESIFPTRSDATNGEPDEATSAVAALRLAHEAPRLAHEVSRPARTARHGAPRVAIPVFPGTNCEDDMARAFRRAGALPHEVVIRTHSPQERNESLDALAETLAQSQILALPGGFSAGDEPGGSAKYIAAVLSTPVIREVLEAHYIGGDRLIVGICNGFQALIRTGLVPYGHFVDREPGYPSLGPNAIGSHVARMVLTRVESVTGPWLSGTQKGEIVSLPVSHGEGRFVAPPELVAELSAREQVAFRYVDWHGRPRDDAPWNPNGSVNGVEGLISPDGRFIGRMGHIERRWPDLDRHVPAIGAPTMIDNGVAWLL